MWIYWLYFILYVLTYVTTLALMASSDKIYITGGFDGHHCMNTAEVYDPNTNQWTMITAMRYRRSGVSCISYHGCVYAIGTKTRIPREKDSIATPIWYKLSANALIYARKSIYFSLTLLTPRSISKHLIAESKKLVYYHSSHRETKRAINDFWSHWRRLQRDIKVVQRREV